MKPDLSMLLALHEASSKLLDAFNAAKKSERNDLAAHISAAQREINKALRQVAVDAGQLPQEPTS